jgi:hypothetical protein
MTSRNADLSVGRRYFAFLGVLLLTALVVFTGPFIGAEPASAAPAAPVLSGQCSVQDWRNPAKFTECVGKLKDLGTSRLQCLSPPTPETPDAGMSGWFASQPASSKLNGPKGLYSRYGYAGYDFTMYDVGCVSPLTHPTNSFENTVANGEFMIATSIIGASNALREKAWEPASLWGWADTLVNDATTALYHKVFTVFGAVTLAIVGLYLMWRSRQSDMSNAMTTAGWALLVMVAVTAIAAWPVRSAHVADATLVGGLNVVHGAIGPSESTLPVSKCGDSTPGACDDVRPPAVRASDTVTDTILYRNWLRGLLGSADGLAATKYGPALYDSRSFTWDQAQQIRNNPTTRDATIAAKQNAWLKIAEQIKTEDPQAYSYLQGNEGMDRIGAGFIAILSALFFAMFDITASVLVLIGFLIFRWAVIAAPVLGTIGLLRPASSGIRRLANAVIAAIFNIIIFGTGAAVYLFAVDLIMNTATLPGWLQVVLVWLVGVVGWLLLRPYRRLTQLGGKDPSSEIGNAGSWHRRFLGDARDAARLDPTRPGSTNEPRMSSPRQRGELETTVVRPESRSEDVVTVRPEAATEPARPRSRRAAGGWQESDAPNDPSGFSIYRPDGAPEPVKTHRPESVTVNR